MRILIVLITALFFTSCADSKMADEPFELTELNITSNVLALKPREEPLTVAKIVRGVGNFFIPDLIAAND